MVKTHKRSPHSCAARGGGGCSGDELSDNIGGCRDHEKVEKARDKRRRRAPMTEPSQELRETPPNGAEPSEGEEVWRNGKDAQEEWRSWWSRMFGSASVV